MKLFVAGLPYDLDDAELEEIFEKFGTVSSARVAMDRETGKIICKLLYFLSSLQ